MATGQGKEQEDVILEAHKEKKKVHFASLMDICHLKNAEFEPKYQKHKGRVVLRGDIVKDDSGACAVFIEQGLSASQMTAAKVMDVSARLPDCARQAADAVSAYTQVKMEDAPKLLSMYTYGYLFHDTSGRNPGRTLKIPWRNLDGKKY